MDVGIQPAAVHDLLGDADLLLELLAGVGVVGVDDAGGVHQIHPAVQLQQEVQVLIVVVGHIVSVLVHRAPQDGVGELVSCGLHLPAPVGEGVGVLGRVDGVQHDGHVAAGRVLHAGRHIETAGCEAVLLILHGAGPDGHIGEDVGDVPPVLGVEHLVRGGEPGLLDGPDVHLAHGNQPGQEVGLLLRVGLMDDALVALPGGPGLVGIDSGDQDQFVLHLVVQLGQPADIVAYRVLVVRGAGADDDEELPALSCDHISDFRIPSPLDFGEPLRERVLLSDLVRRGKMLYECKAHGIFLCRSNPFCSVS